MESLGLIAAGVLAFLLAGAGLVALVVRLTRRGAGDKVKLDTLTEGREHARSAEERNLDQQTPLGPDLVELVRRRRERRESAASDG